MSDNPPTVIPFLTERAKSLQRQFVSFNDIKPRLESSYLIQGWLGSGGLSILYGPSNSGKTFIAADLAAHVASGFQWRGNKVRSGPVIYVAAEGGVGISHRFAAIRQAREMLQVGAGFHLLPTHLDLFGPDDAAAFCTSMPVAKAALIVVDTMARSMGAGDENSARDVAQFVRNCDFIRERTGAHVLIVHHSGKNAEAGARGSSALRAAVDTEIAVSERQISCTKQRDMEIPSRLFFDLKSVELGVDQDGDPVTSAVVVPADAPAMKAKPLKGKAEVAMQALGDALREHGETKHGSDFPANRKCVSIENWREKCGVHGLTEGTSASAARTAFMRVKDKLMEVNQIRIFGGFVWRVSDD